MQQLNFEQQKDIGLKFVLDLLEPACPYGTKRLKNLHIYLPEEKAELEAELENVAVLRQALDQAPEAVELVRHSLSTLKDVSGSLKNCKVGSLTEVELFELTAFALRMKELIPRVQALPDFARLSGMDFVPVEEALAVLDPGGSGRLSFYVEDSRTPALQASRREKRALEKQLHAPGADRAELLARRLTAAKAEEEALGDIYRAMSLALRPLLPGLEQNAQAAGRLDAGLCKALLARRFSGVCPKLGGQTLCLQEAENPRIAEALAARGQQFTPITIEMPKGVTVLTGANMGGKSVAMKTVTLNVALALMGFFVFCKQAQIPLFRRIELINRDLSSTEGGLSSFGGEILRFNEAAARLKAGGPVFMAMDEFARGTNAQEGAAIARGVVKYLADKDAVVLLATHYDGTAEYAARHYQVRGLRRMEDRQLPRPKDAKAGIALISEYMDYGLISVDKGAECPRDALRICRILGMDDEILNNIL